MSRNPVFDAMWQSAATRLIVALGDQSRQAALTLVQQLSLPDADCPCVITQYQVDLRLLQGGSVGTTFLKTLLRAAPRVGVDLSLFVGTKVGLQRKVRRLVKAYPLAYIVIPLGSDKQQLQELVALTRGHCKLYGTPLHTTVSAAQCLAVYGRRPDQLVAERAQLFAEVGGDGILCSPPDLIRQRYLLPTRVELVGVGIRGSSAEANDHERRGTAANMISQDASRLIVGRPVTSHPSLTPRQAMAALAEEIAIASLVHPKPEPPN